MDLELMQMMMSMMSSNQQQMPTMPQQITVPEVQMATGASTGEVMDWQQELQTMRDDAASRYDENRTTERQLVESFMPDEETSLLTEEVNG